MNFNFPFTLAPKVGLHIIHNVHKYIDSAEKKAVHICLCNNDSDTCTQVPLMVGFETTVLWYHGAAIQAVWCSVYFINKIQNGT